MASGDELMSWFEAQGVEFHPSLYLGYVAETGLSVLTRDSLPQDTTVVTVPASLCITANVAHSQISKLLSALNSSLAVDGEALPEADWILLYLVVSRIATQCGYTHESLAHAPYVAHIPEVLSPLHFSSTEQELLINTPLHASNERRLRETVVDCNRASALLNQHLQLAKDEFASVLKQTMEQSEGLQLWRWAETAFTSRAFPSRLIGITKPATSTPSTSVFTEAVSSPILIPAYDMFNHARAHPVTWSHMESDKVAMVLNYAITEAGSQVFNNYGGKSNEEFLSGYGFTVPTISEDTLALKLSAEEGMTERTHYWPMIPTASIASKPLGSFTPAACPCPTLLQDLQSRVLQGEPIPTDDQDSLDLYATVLETLESLLLSKRKAFKKSQTHVETLAQTKADIRESVWSNVRQYRNGQLAIMNAAIAWTRTELETVADALDAIS